VIGVACGNTDTTPSAVDSTRRRAGKSIRGMYRSG